MTEEDAVNILQASVDILKEHAHPTAKTIPTDSYEEQREWIGNLCRFRDDEDDDWESYGILTDVYSYIDDHQERCVLYKNGNNNIPYSYCEPLDLNDYIIIAKRK